VPSLTTLSEGTNTLTTVSEASSTLASLSEASSTLTALAELTNTTTTHLGYFPDTVLFSAPYPYPSSTSYPGDTYTTPATGLANTALSEGTTNLTVLTEV
jgi:hypothetical protein